MLRRIAVVLVVALAAGCGSAASTEQTDIKSSDAASLDRVSNRGTPFKVSLTGREEEVLSRMTRAAGPIEGVSILATRGDRAFYRLSDHCYGVGPINRIFGAVSCVPRFPSAEVPVLDFTVFGSTVGPDERPNPETLTVHASQGVAADGVAKVALLDAGGHVVAVTSVADNVYRFDPVPAGNATKVVAYDTRGEVVFSQPH